MPRHAVFISYAHRYKPWVTDLKANLELSLPGQSVFLDEDDLASGRSWLGQLQMALDVAESFILVATPEALASPWVKQETEGYLTGRKGKLHIVQLVDTPLPTFFKTLQMLDFRNHDRRRYRARFKQLLEGLGAPRSRLPAGLTVPETPDYGLLPELRSELVSTLAPLLETKLARAGLASFLDLGRGALEDHGSRECTASATLVLATGDDRPAAGALRVLAAAGEAGLTEGRSELGKKLLGLQERLERAHDADPEDDLLRFWQRRVASDHSRLNPLFDEGLGEELLETVYVTLSLRQSERALHKGEDPEEAISPGRSWTLQELLKLDPDRHSWITRRFVVRGDPGAGKTTLLRHLAASLAQEARPHWVPIYEPLTRLVREPAFLLERLEQRCRQGGDPARGLAGVLDALGQEGRLLLLLDGLDEIRREERDRAEELLRDLLQRWPETPFVISTRKIGYRRPEPSFVEVDVESLGRDQQEELLERWLGRRGADAGEKAVRALDQLEREASLAELARNPLYLTLMALLIEEGKTLDRNRPRLYDQVFELLLAGRHRRSVEPIERQETVRRVLRHLAHEMTVDNRDGESLDALDARLFREDAEPLRRQLEQVKRWRRDLEHFFADVAERTGILAPYDGRHADWRFWHRTFREALAAERLEELYDESADAILEHARTIAGDESRWAEPYALLTGRVREADELVTRLMAENPKLGLRALATAQSLSDASIGAVLKLTEKWEERTEVFARLPDLIDDAERLLLLVDRLRKGTRNGNDLFFLDQAVAAAGRKWPDWAQDAAALRVRFYDHIPVPPEELFTTIDTPRDGRVDLWRTIPAGEFLMGSPPDDDQAYTDERPHHAVRIVAPFVLGAVPVTNAQYAVFEPDHPWEAWEGVSEDELAFHPVVNVTWYQAVSFCRWLSESLPWAQGARLPREEEWEYACRAGTTTRYWSGDEEKDLVRVGWYGENAGGRTHRVGEKPANAWGLFDVHGNVWEWTQSEWTDDYSDRPSEDAVDPRSDPADLAASSGVPRVIRGGGCWDAARDARAACRNWRNPGVEARNRGFRVLLPSPRSDL